MCLQTPKFRHIKKINRTLKETLTKLSLKTDNDWVTLLPFILEKIQNSLYQTGVTPLKIMFGSPTDRSYYKKQMNANYYTILRISSEYPNVFGLNFMLP